MPSHLLLGGARSGKSRYAETLAHGSGLNVTVVATAQPLDAEMAHRIARHRKDRPPAWVTVETPVALAHSLRAHDAPDTCVVIDCVTLWLSNLFGSLDERHPLADAVESGLLAQETRALVELVPCVRGSLILVSNEIGLGLVPDTALGRVFRDEAGRLNQQLAQQCDQVSFIVAGLPLRLK